jgi:CRISPR-associated endonuclease/helicase Cas3
MNGQKYLAHIEITNGREQTVLEHLKNTASLSAQFAEPFHAANEAYACGMLHDLGKYSNAFQKRLHGGMKTDHSTAGAKVAISLLKDQYIAFCVAGHHSGLPDLGSSVDSEESGTLWARLKKNVEDFSSYQDEVVLPPSRIPKELITTPFDSQFFIRMLYSCLVDADFLDTESFMSNDSIERMHHSIEPLRRKLNAYIEPWMHPCNALNKERCNILNAVINGANNKQGLFTLTVPTGGGKTIASMAFALQHAAVNNMSRVIYVIPYCSIIEQTQHVFENVFGNENVIAHYANVEYDTENHDESNKRYLAAENWDSPIVLTTAVQFFESLYGNKSSICRKLHNIANSVIIFDEAQMMPVSYLTPCCEAISELIRNYHCTAVLCTATQPALNRLFSKPEMLPDRNIIELYPHNEIKPIFQRVSYQFDGNLSDEDLAQRLKSEDEVLCIVNSRDQAHDLYNLVGGDGIYHLSTRMTANDRKKILRIVKQRLLNGETCKVISTSLIEAGVDVDFPTVYRSFAGLDSIIQAGGRCNREGKQSKSNSIVHVFDTNRTIPPLLLQNIQAAKKAIEEVPDPTSEQCISKYFEFLFYTLRGEDNLDSSNAIQGSNQMKFKSVSESFHLIETSECTVYVSNEKNREAIKQYRLYGPNRQLMRLLSTDAVSIPVYQFREMVRKGDVEKVDENTGILVNELLYDCNTGLCLEDISLDEFVI